MPQIPTYDSPQVSLEQDPTSFQGPSNAGEQYVALGAALQGAGSDLNSIALDQQHLANADTVMKTEAAFKSDYLKLQQSLQARRGQSAWGVTDDVNNWFAKAAPQYSNALENDAQRRAFAATFDSVRQQALETTGKYEADQRRQSAEESGMASIQGSINMAAADHNNAATIAGARTDITRRVQLLAQLNGWAPETTDYKMTNALTDLHKQVIGALVDESPDRARAYYEANKQEIAGSEQDVIDKLIKQGTLAQVGQQGAAAILGQGLSETQALAQARSKYTGREQDEVVRRVQERYAEVDAIRERDQKTAADRAWNIYSRSGGLSAVPPTVLAGMDGQALLALQKEDAARVSGKLVDTDYSKFYDLKNMALTNPQAFATRDLRTDFPYLSTDDRKLLIDQQNTIKSGTSNDIAGISEQLTLAHNTLGISGNKTQMGAFDSAATLRMQAEADTLKRKLSFEERQKVIDQMIISGTIHTGPIGDFIRGFPIVHPALNLIGAGPDRRFYEVDGTDKAEGFKPDVGVKNIPLNERQKMSDALKRANQPVTNDALEKLWFLKLRKEGIIKSDAVNGMQDYSGS